MEREYPHGLMTLKEVAKVFNVTTSTAARWARNGKIRAIHTPGGRLRFEREEIYRHLEPVDMTGTGNSSYHDLDHQDVSDSATEHDGTEPGA